MLWLDQAKRHLGEHEIAGRTDNQFILDCFKYTGYKASHDEIAWCAAFVCRMLEESGYKSTRSAAAASFLHFGASCDLKPGAILVFKWASGHHHVTLCHHVIDHHYVAAIGGNQSNQVKISVYPRSRVEASRWPIQLLGPELKLA